MARKRGCPPEWPDSIPLVAFPPGGLYREAMFERIVRERRHWYVAFSGSSLHGVLVAVETGLGLSLLPIGTTTGRHVRQYARFGIEPSMVVSIHLPDPAEAGGLSALMQGGGFLITARPPWIVAMLHDLTGGFAADWMLHLACAVIVALLYWRVDPRSYEKAMKPLPAGFGHEEQTDIEMVHTTCKP